MLLRENRLRKPYEINRVYKRGVYGGSGGVLSVKALRAHGARSRAVVVVGKKVSKKAVVRNTIRRRVAGQLVNIWGTVAPGYDIVISVHQDVSKLPANDLTQALQRALKRTGAITS